MAKTGTPQYIRSLNENLVLGLLFEQGGLSRADISRLSGLSKPTVSAAVQKLIDRGLALESGQGDNAQGRKSTRVEFNLDAYRVCGVELGAERIRLAVARLDGAILAFEEFDNVGQAPADTLRTVRERLDRMIGKQDGDGDGGGANVPCVGFAVPAVVRPDSGIISLIVDRLRGFERDLSTEALAGKWPGTLVVAENDVNLAATAERDKMERDVAEQAVGNGGEDGPFVYLSLDAGVGAGLIVNGQLLRGRGGAAGEIGQMKLGDGRRVEQALSLDGLNRLVEETLRAAGAPSEWRGGERTPQAVFRAVRSGDAVALAIAERYAEGLAFVLNHLTAILAPGRIVLGGEIGSHAEALIPMIKERLDDGFPVAPELAVSALGEKGPVQGAVRMAARRTLEWMREEGAERS